MILYYWPRNIHLHGLATMLCGPTEYSWMELIEPRGGTEVLGRSMSPNESWGISVPRV